MTITIDFDKVLTSSYVRLFFDWKYLVSRCLPVIIKIREWKSFGQSDMQTNFLRPCIIFLFLPANEQDKVSWDFIMKKLRLIWGLISSENEASRTGGHLYGDLYFQNLIPQNDCDLVQFVSGVFEVNRFLIYDVDDIFFSQTLSISHTIT